MISIMAITNINKPKNMQSAATNDVTINDPGSGKLLYSRIFISSKLAGTSTLNTL